MRTQKLSICFFLPQNSAKSANKRLHAKCMKYSNFYNIFAIVWPILMKFRTAKHIRLPKLMSDQKFENFKMQVERWRPTRQLRKNSTSFYSLPQNSEKNANNHFHAKLWNIQTFTIPSNVWPILMKFCRMTHISCPEHNSCSKSQFKKKFQMVDAAV